MIENKRVICFGEVLWDNLLEGRRIGGAPLNVCYHLSKFGIQSKIISQIGDDENGKEITKELDRLGVDYQYCFKTNAYPTSTVEVHVLANTKVEYDIVEGVAWDYIPYTDEMEAVIKNSDAFVYGSLAARNIASRTSLFNCIANAKWIIFDINLRAPFYSKELIEDMISPCHTLKINDDELVIVAEWLNDNSQEETQNIATLFSKFVVLKEILLTKGSQGASYYSREEVIHVDAIRINVSDTVGSGDSFLAAFIANKMAGNSLNYCMKEAVVLSAFMATFPGACPAYNADEIVKFKTNHQYV
ncbi:carbohydrate kinase family protein [Pedobacter heparinus]|uniref:PfkB domain protein n=1 Tax=Pedobacter heparinus (strain ATCC 13125 / DSM 2366 / CIP 104194 / JCM 7457 / NBRC 12017 / NCIMB 9290 / NRRL B-14731 / HIM 762-3) TaxID=485917 RepID=C6XUU6_PEDHD|nr:carbohydrate kinase [Pedobacter heparinus]ACU05954.1 PfkB domain protein [Pedobacter heparinus DSM 2366]